MNNNINLNPESREVDSLKIKDIIPRISRIDDLPKTIKEHIIHKETDKDYIEWNKSGINDDRIMSTRKEIWGWYLFDVANQPFYTIIQAYVGVVYFVSLMSEYACKNTTQYGCTVDFKPINDDSQLKVKFLGVHLNIESVYFIIQSISGGTQVIIYIFFAALGDYGSNQYYLFIIFSVLANIAMLPYCMTANDNWYTFYGLWSIVTPTLLGLALIFYNSWFVDLIDNHFYIYRFRDNILLTEKLRNHLSDVISSIGLSVGYFGGFIMLILIGGVFLFMPSENTEIITITSDNYIKDKTLISYKELWISKVNSVNISYNDAQITSMKFEYNNIDTEPNIYGTFSDNSIQFNVNNDNINSIFIWANNANIFGMQFITENGNSSQVMGYTNQGQTYLIKSKKNYVLGGYKAYINSNTNIIVSAEFLFYNKNNPYYTMTPFNIIYSMVFVWWFIIQPFTFKSMKKRIKQPWPTKHSLFYSLITISIKDMYKTIKDIRHVPNLGKYLISWFFFSDGLNTMTQVAILATRTVFNFTGLETGLLSIVGLTGGILGGVVSLMIQKKLEVTTKHMLMYHLFVFSMVQLYIFNASWSPIFNTRWEVWIVVVVIAFNIGPIQAFSRSFLSVMIPKGMENKVFTISMITDKGSSWIGPLIASYLTAKFGIWSSMGYCFIVCFGSFWYLHYYINTDDISVKRESIMDFSGMDIRPKSIQLKERKRESSIRLSNNENIVKRKESAPLQQ